MARIQAGVLFQIFFMVLFFWVSYPSLWKGGLGIKFTLSTIPPSPSPWGNYCLLSVISTTALAGGAIWFIKSSSNFTYRSWCYIARLDLLHGLRTVLRTSSVGFTKEGILSEDRPHNLRLFWKPDHIKQRTITNGIIISHQEIGIRIDEEIIAISNRFA